MKITQLSNSLPQPVFDAMQVQSFEPSVAKLQGLSLYQLMEQAGLNVFNHIRAQYPDKNRLFVICGKGNNGGDGYVIARLAAQAGFEVEVSVLAEEQAIKGEALSSLTALKTLKQQSPTLQISINFRGEQGLTSFVGDRLNAFFNGDPERTLFEASLIVDCIFGIGFNGKLAADYQHLIDKLNQLGPPIVSVDVPSGLCATSGTIKTTAIAAAQTVTFFVFKQGLLTGKAADHVGQLFVADLDGAALFWQHCHSNIYLQTAIQLPSLARRKPTSHKGTIGRLLAIGGNKGMPGAVRLAGEAALRAGAGLVSVACHQSNQVLVGQNRAELMFAPNEHEALTDFIHHEKIALCVIGPGLGQDEWAQSRLELVLNSNLSLVIDADALHLLAKAKKAELLSFKQDEQKIWVLTPHPKEAAVLLGCETQEVEQNRFETVKKIAEQYQCVCVLKGAGSLISDGKTTWINSSGNAGMASGGMGDVLAGLIGALLMQMAEPLSAVRLAVYLHGLAADIIADRNGQRGMLASDLFPEIQRLVNR